MNEENISTSLRSLDLLGKKPIIGFLMFFVGILIFIILAYNVINNGLLLNWDLPIVQWFHALALSSPIFITNIMVAGYYLGYHGIIVVAVLLAIYFIYKRFWKELFIDALTLGGGGLLFTFISKIFMRPRPFLLFAEKIWAGSPNIPGFPSGHTLSIVTCCLFLVYLFLPKLKSYFGKTLVVLIASLVIFYIGFSRLYVGDHYFTDVIAGYAVGFAWFGLTVTFIELLFKKYRK